MSLREPLKVLIIDDSKVIRMMLHSVLANIEAVEVVGEAENAEQALELIIEHKPDLITLDVVMPGMDGISFHNKLSKFPDFPHTILISNVNIHTAMKALTILDKSKVEFLNKPEKDEIQSFSKKLQNMVQSLHVKQFNYETIDQSAVQSVEIQVISIGASTGGVDAINHLLSRLPAKFPPILISLHMPQLFLETYVSRLGKQYRAKILLVDEQMPLRANQVYFSTAEANMIVDNPMGEFMVCRRDATNDQIYCPSIDTLFFSTARHFNNNVMAIMLSGLGNDGVNGFSRLYQLGAHTIAQDEATSEVWGMPLAAINANAVKEVLSIGEIAKRIETIAQISDERDSF